MFENFGKLASIMSRIPAILAQVVVVMPTSQLEIRNRVLCVKDEKF